MYIPKNRILTNQYTSDNKLMIKETQEFYRGFYYKQFDGKYFSGKTPNDPPNVELVEVCKKGMNNGVLGYGDRSSCMMV